MSALVEWLKPYRDRLERGELGIREVDGEPLGVTELLARRRLPVAQVAEFDAHEGRPLWDWSEAARWLIQVSGEARWRRGADPCACACGDEGVGKTQGLAIAGLRLAREGRRIAYLAAHEDDLRRAWANWEEYRSADVLLLDELHRLDNQPEVNVGRVIGLIDLRYRQQRPMLACATCPVGEPATKSTPPWGLHRILGSEVLARFAWLAGFAGESHRERREVSDDASA